MTILILGLVSASSTLVTRTYGVPAWISAKAGHKGRINRLVSPSGFFRLKGHMSKKLDNAAVTSQEDAFEMIELLSDDLNLLADAFDIISEACAELDAKPELVEPKKTQIVWH